MYYASWLRIARVSRTRCFSDLLLFFRRQLRGKYFHEDSQMSAIKDSVISLSKDALQKDSVRWYVHPRVYELYFREKGADACV